MFGKRNQQGGSVAPAILESVRSSTPRADPSLRVTPITSTSSSPPPPPLTIASAPPRPSASRKTDEYYELKAQVFTALVEAIDVGELARLDRHQARDSIGEVVREIIAAKKVVISIVEQDE